MAIIIHIETSAAVCSVALSENSRLLSLRKSKNPRSHASELAILLENIWKENNISPSQLDAVSVSMGPGSYTGLRIGVSTAKGLCYGAGIPLLTIDTLKILAAAGKTGMQKILNSTESENFLLCPMLDARRMEVYAALYNPQLEVVEPTKAIIVDRDSFTRHLNEKKVFFFGPGAEKCKETITHPNAVFLADIEPTAEYMIPFAVEDFEQQKFANLAYFEPYYLKDFVATIPKKKVL